MANPPSVASSLRNSTICAAVTILLMLVLRPVLKLSPETTFLGGLFGAILFFFLIIMVGNLNDKRGTNELGWFSILFCEIISVFVSYFIHPVCITTCFLFSIPVVIYVKWASTKMRSTKKQ